MEDIIQGYFYLHENMDLIYKRGADSIVDIQKSDFCLRAWAFDWQRKTAWRILIESHCLWALTSRVEKLAEDWWLDNDDALVYAWIIWVKLGWETDVNWQFSYTAKVGRFTWHWKSFLYAMRNLCFYMWNSWDNFSKNDFEYNVKINKVL